MTSTDPSFLTERANGTLAYKATESGHLGHVFEIFTIYPEIALRVASVTLDEKLDGPHNSHILDFAERYGIEPDMRPFDDEDYESISEDGSNTEKGLVTGIEEVSLEPTEVKENETSSFTAMTTQAAVLSAAHPVAVDVPATDHVLLFDEPESFDAHDHRDCVKSGHTIAAAAVKQRLQEAVDDYKLILEMSDIQDGDEIPIYLYLRLLRAMLVVCNNVTRL